MPYSLEKIGKKYYVVDTSGRRYSKKPLSLVKAKKQITALHIHTGHGLCQSLLSTEYEEPVIPQMITRRFADDSAMHRTEEYPSIIPRKKKSIKSKIVDYIIESNKKDTGYGTYDWEKLGFVPKRFIKNPVHGKGKRKCKGGTKWDDYIKPLKDKIQKVDAERERISKENLEDQPSFSANYNTSYPYRIPMEGDRIVYRTGKSIPLPEKIDYEAELINLVRKGKLDERDIMYYIIHKDEDRVIDQVFEFKPGTFIEPKTKEEASRLIYELETTKKPHTEYAVEKHVKHLKKLYNRLPTTEELADQIKADAKALSKLAPTSDYDPRDSPHFIKRPTTTSTPRPPTPKGNVEELATLLGQTKLGEGKYSEPDTHILIGDELKGCGRKDTLREEYELIMRRPNLTQQAKDDLVRIYQAGLHKLNQKGKSRILGILTNSKIAKEKDDILQNTIDLMHRRVPIQLIQRSRFSTELTPEQMSENLATSLLREYVDQEVDDPRNYVEKGEGKHKFVKKYLKGQGIPATKKNVEKICNIMDVEGVVFE